MKHIITLPIAILFGQFFYMQPVVAPKTFPTVSETYVYICTGGSSKRYHKTDRCKGLDNCKGTIKKVTLAYAEDKGRTPCKICYKKR